MSTLGIVLASYLGGSLLTFFAYLAWLTWQIRREDRRKAAWIERFPR